MKNAIIYSVCGLIAAGALVTGMVVSSGNRRAMAETVARKVRSTERVKEAEARAAAEETAKTEAEERAAKENRAAKEAERRAREAEREIAKEETKKAEAETKKTEAEARTRAEEAKKAEALATKAKAEAETAKALQAKAEAEKEAKEAEADRAAAELARQESAAKTVKDALALEEIRKGQYEKLLEELNAYKAELDERERTLRPPKTVKDLMTAEGAAGSLFEEDEYDDAPTAGFTRKKKKAARILPENDPTVPYGERRLSRANRLSSETVSFAAATTRSNLVSKLERLMRESMRQDRVTEAEFYLATIRSLYPDYIPPRMEAK